MTDRYFDHAATSPLDPRVLAEMQPYLTGEFGNAHSLHSFGRRAMAAVDLARERVAELVGALDPSLVVFTSGATEANNWIAKRAGTFAVSPFEHSSMLEPARARGAQVLGNRGFTLRLPTRAQTVAVMRVNNETGAILDVNSARTPDNWVHSDVTQAVGKVPLDGLDADSLSLSAHKIGGPKGVGALVFREPPAEPLLRGGEQEGGLRGGTLNVPGVVGLGLAAALAGQEFDQRRAAALRLRGVVLEQLRGLSDWQSNDHREQSPFILSLSFRGIRAEPVLIDLDSQGFAVSSGAACSSRSTEPSHVLTALGLATGWLEGTLRISVGPGNTAESAEILGQALRRSVESLRRMRNVPE